MRIGECADLSFDCLRATGPNQWAVHVPLGNLKTERMVRVAIRLSVASSSAYASFVLLIHCLQTAFFWRVRTIKRRSFVSFESTCTRYCYALGLSTRIVPHELRHT